MKKKIAVLGGGIGSLSTVFELTSEKDWQKNYDITVYQMGWRLGGKGASGRNPEFADRIEEHGLHVWFGFYDNAFEMIKRCYSENGRKPGEALSTWQEAFEPGNSFVCMEKVNGVWEKWPLVFPENSEVPGIGNNEPISIWGSVIQLIKVMIRESISGMAMLTFGEKGNFSATDIELFEKVQKGFMERLNQYFALLGQSTDSFSPFEAAAKMEEFLWMLDKTSSHEILAVFLEDTRAWFYEQIKESIESSHPIRRAWTMLDFVSANILGIIRDKVITDGFDAINPYDYREWVAMHSVTPDLTSNSSLVAAFYSVNFSGLYRDTLEAGTGLIGGIRAALTYKGAYYFRMQAGMGDVVFTPIYEVLKKRGVKFKFFHKVKNLQLNKEKNEIEGIQILRQVDLIDPIKEYYPLYNVKGLASWPSVPLYNQIENGAELKNLEINLESFYNNWKDKEELTLKKGIDFDLVVFGIPVGAIPYLCTELIQANDSWKKMIAGVKTAATLAAQFWLKPSLSGLGWPFRTENRSMVGTYEIPFETNTDLSHLIARENWPADNHPFHLAYLCGTMEEERIPDENNPDLLKEWKEKVWKSAEEYLDVHANAIWPNAISRETGKFDRNLLVNLARGTEKDIFEGQYIRANLDPSERYVLSVVGNTASRLKAGESGFDNLVLAGDWVDTGMNVGSIEPSVISGMQACQAITGKKAEIRGATFVTCQPLNENGENHSENPMYQMIQLYKHFSS